MRETCLLIHACLVTFIEPKQNKNDSVLVCSKICDHRIVQCTFNWKWTELWFLVLRTDSCFYSYNNFTILTLTASNQTSVCKLKSCCCIDRCVVSIVRSEHHTSTCDRNNYCKVFPVHILSMHDHMRGVIHAVNTICTFWKET